MGGTTVICDSCGHIIHTGQPAQTLHQAMAALASAARQLGYTVESVTLAKAKDGEVA